jgi:hypothetical protein
MAGILQAAVFLKSHPFSKFHPLYIGIRNISTGFTKNSHLQNSSHLAWILKKDEITKNSPLQNISLSYKIVSHPPFP